MTNDKQMEDVTLCLNQVTLCVLGPVGCGKSSFINTLFSTNDPGFKIRQISEVVVHEVRTAKDLVNLQKQFDVMAVVSPVEYKNKLLEEIEKINYSSFYFVRTFIDADITGQRRRYKGSYRTTETLSSARDIARQSLASNSQYQDKEIFLVSNYEPEKFDFPRLVEAIIADLPEDKKFAFVSSLGALNKTTIEAKYKWLYSRRGHIATMCQTNFSHLTKEIMLYRRQLGLDSIGLTKLSKRVGTELKTVPTSRSSLAEVTELTADITKRYQILRFDTMGKSNSEKSLKNLLVEILSTILSEMKKDALNVHEEVLTSDDKENEPSEKESETRRSKSRQYNTKGQSEEILKDLREQERKRDVIIVLTNDCSTDNMQKVHIDEYSKTLTQKRKINGYNSPTF